MTKARLSMMCAGLLATGLQARSEESWKFMAFADSRGPTSAEQVNTNIVSELARQAVAHNVAFVLFGGDLVYWGGLEPFQIWTNAVGPALDGGIPVYPILGNHDLPDVASYLALFGPGIPDNGPPGEIDRTYAIWHRNAVVLMLDLFGAETFGRVNQAWIDAVVATNQAPHVFAMSHYPAFKSAHYDCLDDYPTNRNVFWQSLAAARSRIYFSGHDHFYDHARIDDGDGNPDNDVHQMIVGTGGSPFYGDYPYDGDNAGWTPTRIFHEANFGFVLVQVESLKVRATWFHRVGPDDYLPGGDVFSYSLVPRPALSFEQAEGQLRIVWTGGWRLQVSARPSGPFVDLPGASSPFVVPSPGRGGAFFRLVEPPPALQKE